MSTISQLKTKLLNALNSKLSIGEQALTEEQQKKTRANINAASDGDLNNAVNIINSTLSSHTSTLSYHTSTISSHNTSITSINSTLSNSTSLNRNTTIGNRNSSWDDIVVPGYYNVVPGSDWDNSLGTPNVINGNIYKYGMLEVSMAAGTLTQKYWSHAGSTSDCKSGGMYLRMKWAGNTSFNSWVKYIPSTGVYPIGSVYISVNDTNPGTLFGGTWEQLQNRFLLGAGSSYTNGATGGEASHTLTIGETPSHRHWISNGQYDDGNCSTTNETSPRQDCGLMADAGTYSINDTCKSNGRYSAYGAGSLGVDGKGTAVGTTSAHNNMPPYLVVYMWKRTA